MRVRIFVGYFIVTQYVKLIIITMKKFLLSIFCCLMAVFAVQAQEANGIITFKSADSDSSTSATNSNFVTGQVVDNGGFTLTCTATNNCYTGINGLKMSSSSKNGSFTLKLGKTYNVKTITVNAVKYKTDAAKLSVNDATPQTLTESAEDYIFDVNSEISQIKVDMTKRGYIASVSIVYINDESSEEVTTLEKPVISPAESVFNLGELFAVEISAEDGATIHYTLDGNDPTEASATYSTPIQITETTTVKAIAVKEGCKNSEVAEATYTAIDPNALTATLSFADEAQRTSLSTTQQVWEQNGVTFTNNKGTGSNIVAYANPVRLYKNSEVVLEMEEGMVINKIEFACNTTGYANDLATSIGDNAIVSGKVVTVASFAEESNSFVISSLSGGQVRLDEITVTYTEKPYHTLTVTDAGMATLYLGFNARIPSAVEAYTVTAVNNGWVTLTQVTGVLPLNQGVIIKATAGTYKLFNETTATADVTGNLLEGSAYNKNIDEEAYVLGNVDGKVGLYKAEMNQLDGDAWLNNANKAYLPASSVPNKTVEFYGFDWGGTTGIENIEGVAGNNFGEGAIYDLTGRKINSIAVTGIYIIDGKKVFIRK